MSIDWGAVWNVLAPILREAFIAFLVALLALLGYDRQVLPARLLKALKSLGFEHMEPPKGGTEYQPPRGGTEYQPPRGGTEYLGGRVVGRGRVKHG